MDVKSFLNDGEIYNYDFKLNISDAPNYDAAL